MEKITRHTPRNLPVKILAIGAGGLQRALTHELVDELNRRGMYNGGIFVGQPQGTAKAEAFNRQGGLYHVVTFDLTGIKEIKLISSVVGATTLSTPDGRENFYAQTKNQLDLILIGVTEAGIAKGQVGMDVLDETLYRYFCHHGPDSTLCVINTDNIRDNGNFIRRILIDEYPKRGAAYAGWLENNVGFLNEMGDRLVPQVYAVPEGIQNEASQRIGKRDELITYTERMPAIPLILQDEKGMLRVPFSALADLGVMVTPGSIDPHHDWKLLLINSVHIPGITHKGMLSGIQYVHEAASHPIFAPHLERLMAGYAKIVEADIPIKGRSAHAYTMEFIHRIRRIQDDNARINIIETLKLRERAADIIRSPNYNGATDLFKEEFAYAVATVLRFLTPHRVSHVENSRDGAEFTGITDVGTTYMIKDPNRTIQEILSGAFGASAEDVQNRLERIFSNTDPWTPPGASTQVELSRNQDFMRRIGRYYHRLVTGESCLGVLAGIRA